jgi:hypothetical protein
VYIERMNNKSERLWKEIVLAILFQLLTGWAEEN